MKADNLVAACPFSTSGGMQRVAWQIDGGGFNGGRGGVVPFNTEAKDFICTSRGGTYDWTQFSSDRDRDGNSLPLPTRLVLNDTAPHEIMLYIDNSHGTSGSAMIGDIELVSPSGQIVPVIGQFDTTPLDQDTAWFNRAYGDLFGGKSPVGAHMPLVRGETGIDSPGKLEWNHVFSPSFFLSAKGSYYSTGFTLKAIGELGLREFDADSAGEASVASLPHFAIPPAPMAASNSYVGRPARPESSAAIKDAF